MKKKIFIVFMIVFVVGVSVFSYTYYQSYRVNSSSVIYVNESGTCKKVNNTGSYDVFIPTNTDAEWISFYTNPPAGVAVSNFLCCGDITGSYSQTKNPGTITEIVDQSAGWTFLDYAKISDNQDAYSAVWYETSTKLAATNFGFTLPSNAVITGFVAIAETDATTNADAVGYFNMYNGSYLGNEKNYQYLSELETNTSVGASNDMWGLNYLSYSTINSANFGFTFHFSGDDSSVYLDQMKLVVYYSLCT